MKKSKLNKKKVLAIENLAVISEKKLKELLLFQYTENLRFDWAKLVVDAFEAYEHSKELLLLINKCLKNPELWHSLRKKDQKDGGKSRNRIQKNIKSTWRKKSKGIKRGKK
jgi:hypothetical protein